MIDKEASRFSLIKVAKLSNSNLQPIAFYNLLYINLLW